MHREAGHDPSLIGALRDLFADLTDLVKKEARLAKAEASAAISNGVQAGIYMAGAAFLGIAAFLLLIWAIVFGIASMGLALHWACLIVALVLAALAGGAFYFGRSLANEALKPTRSVKQINEDIGAVREQLT